MNPARPKVRRGFPCLHVECMEYRYQYTGIFRTYRNPVVCKINDFYFADVILPRLFLYEMRNSDTARGSRPMTIIPAFVRAIGLCVVSVLISGCAASPGPTAYAPQSGYQANYVDPSYVPEPYYGAPAGYYAPGYAYGSYPYYGRTSLDFTFFGSRYYDDRRSSHRSRGKGHKRNDHSQGRGGKRKKGEGRNRDASKGDYKRGGKRGGRKGHSMRNKGSGKRHSKRAKSNEDVVAATVRTPRSRTNFLRTLRRGRGSQR